MYIIQAVIQDYIDTSNAIHSVKDAPHDHGPGLLALSHLLQTLHLRLLQPQLPCLSHCSPCVDDEATRSQCGCGPNEAEGAKGEGGLRNRVKTYKTMTNIKEMGATMAITVLAIRRTGIRVRDSSVL